MSVGLFIIFMLISPGFCLAYAMRIFSRHDLKIDTQNNTAQLIILIIISACIQAILIPAYILSVKDFVDINLTEFLFNKKEYLFFVEPKGPHAFLYRKWYALIGYVIYAYSISTFIGFLLIKIVEEEWISTKLFHGAMYPLINGLNKPVIYCSVLTDSQHDNHFLMYRGQLQEVSYVSKHKIEYVTLSHVDRYMLHVDSLHNAVGTVPKNKDAVTYFPDPKSLAKLKTTDPFSPSAAEKPNEDDAVVPMERLVIKGEAISNILFSRSHSFEDKSLFLHFILIIVISFIITGLIYPALWINLYLFLKSSLVTILPVIVEGGKELYSAIEAILRAAYFSRY